MEESLRKRKNKWLFSFEASNVDGKRKRIKRIGGRTKQEYKTALRNTLIEYKNTGLHLEPTVISVSDYLDYWYKNYVNVNVNCKYNTPQGYKNIIEKHIKISFRDI